MSLLDYGYTLSQLILGYVTLYYVILCYMIVCTLFSPTAASRATPLGSKALHGYASLVSFDKSYYIKDTVL